MPTPKSALGLREYAGEMRERESESESEKRGPTSLDRYNTIYCLAGM